MTDGFAWSQGFNNIMEAAHFLLLSFCMIYILDDLFST